MADPIRLYLDEDSMGRALVRALRSRSVDVLTAREANHIQVLDADHLAHAAALGRVVFTFNVRDFARLHKEFLAAGRSHAGIIVSDQLPVGVLLRRLLTLLAARSATDMREQLEFLGNWR